MIWEMIPFVHLKIRQSLPTGEIPLLCQSCLKAFKLLFHLKSHKSVLLDEILVNCQRLCSFAYRKINIFSIYFSYRKINIFLICFSYRKINVFLESLKTQINFRKKNFYHQITSIPRWTQKIWFSRQNLDCNLMQ